MSIFDSVTPKRNLSEPFSGSFSESTGATLGSSSAIVDEKGRNILDLEIGLQSVDPIANPYTTSVLQSEIKKLKEVA